MYKLILVVLALIAVASAQFIASPYAYGAGIYRSYGAYPYAYGAYASPYYGGYLYK